MSALVEVERVEKPAYIDLSADGPSSVVVLGRKHPNGRPEPISGRKKREERRSRVSFVSFLFIDSDDLAPQIRPNEAYEES